MVQPGMDSQKVTQAIAKAGGHFKLISIVLQRTREIIKGGEKLPGFDADKVPGIVLDEILDGSLIIEEPKTKEK
ncbi:DNA-directed RNA polymerase subunit omega [Planctomycetota bacterium]